MVSLHMIQCRIQYSPWELKLEQLDLHFEDTPLPHDYTDRKVHAANMGPIWGRQDTGGPNVCPMNSAI